VFKCEGKVIGMTLNDRKHNTPVVFVRRHKSIVSGWVCALGMSLMGLLFASASAGVIDDLAPGHWYMVPNSRMSAVDPCPQRNCLYSAIEGQEHVMNGWSGGAYDSKRDRLIVWGGGHSGYAGNEIYAFDINTLSWSRVTEPTTRVDPSGSLERTGYYPDANGAPDPQQPRSRHSYEFLEYLPAPVDRFCSFGTGSQYPSGLGDNSTPNVDCLNFDTRQWERRADALTWGLGAVSEYDPVTGHVWMHGVAGGGFLAEFDYQLNRWIAHGRERIEDAWLDYMMTAAIDPVKRKFVAVGAGNVYVWDLSSSSTIRATQVSTTGGAAVVNADSPGLAYDPMIRKIVAWSGGADVYALDLDARRWTRIRPAASNKHVPPAAEERGTFGRFRYIASKNVYIVVNRVHENVFIYKLPQESIRTSEPLSHGVGTQPAVLSR
jgi:hypothetical protein